MKRSFSKTRTAVAAALLIAASVPMTSQTALACSPEIRLNPATGVAMLQTDLAAALAEIEGAVTVADGSQ